MANATVFPKSKTFKRGLKTLNGFQLPEVESRLREYFASKSKLSKGHLIGDVAWRQRVRKGVTTIEDVEFTEAIFKKYGVKNPWD